MRVCRQSQRQPAVETTVVSSYHDAERCTREVFYKTPVEDTAISGAAIGSYTVVFGDFEATGFKRCFFLGEKIGQSGLAKVFKATIKGGPDGSIPYAVKRLRSRGLRKEYKMALFEEVRILRQVQHPHVIDAYLFYRNEPMYYYLVLEHMAGGELLDVVVKRLTYGEKEARDICRILIDTVKHIHDHGIVLRDIEPSNVLLADANAYDDSSIKLSDFDSACVVGDGVVTKHFGSSEFVAPEIIMGRRHGTSVDLWNLGLLVHILICGDHPCYNRDSRKMYISMCSGFFEFRWPSISEDAKDFIGRLLKVNPASRITAAEAIDHPWLRAPDSSLSKGSSLAGSRKAIALFQVKRKMRTAIYTVIAGRMMLNALRLEDFSDAFTLGKKLGKGTFAQVFEATAKVDSENLSCDEIALPRVFAVKRIDRESLSARAERRVYTEVGILNDLRHPRVVEIFYFYESQRHFHLVLELMQGGELLEQIVQKTFYNENEAREICRYILEPLKYVHGQGIVHRDLKPENLLLSSKDDSSSVKIADFGFACSVREGNVSGQFGTALYVAPEILFKTPYDTSVDMWSTGVIFYILLCGHPPFRDIKQGRLYSKIMKSDLIFDGECWKDVSDCAKDLVRQLLNRNSAQRLTAAQALEHPWLHTSSDILSKIDLSQSLDQLRFFNATRKLRAAIHAVMVVNKLVQDVDTPTPV